MAKVKAKTKIAKVKRKKVEILPPEKPSLKGIYSQLLDSIEKEYSLSSSDLHRHRISSGLICTDLVIGGGLCAGWCSVSGQEASGKSTLTAHAMKESLKYDLFIREMLDPEGTVEAVYTGNIFNVKSLTEVIGERNNKGEWIGEPGKIRYSDVNVMDDIFNSLIKTTKSIPDKMYRKENDSWYFVLDPNDKRTSLFRESLGEPDNALKRKTGRLWYLTDNPWPQAFITLDSLPALITEKSDEKDENDKGLAHQARAFSEFLPRLVGKLRRKNVVIMAVNQLREKPMVLFGSPFYEPGGNALKFYASNRNQMFPRVVPPSWRTSGGTNNIAIEKSLIGDSFDEFQYKELLNSKNKWAPPYRKCSMRVWIKDGETSEGRGFDLAFDTWMGFQYSSLAKQVTKNVDKKSTKVLEFRKDMPKGLESLAGKDIPWRDMKALVYGKEFKQREYRDLGEKTAQRLKIDPKLDVRTKLARLVNTGKVSYSPVKAIED